MWIVPDFDYISKMFGVAQKQQGITVEQAFSVAETDAVFQIKVVVQDEVGPVWTFAKGNLTSFAPVWSLPSIDLQLVSSIIFSESTGKDSVELIAGSDSFSRSTTGHIALASADDEEEVPDNHPKGQAVSQAITGAATALQAASTSAGVVPTQQVSSAPVAGANGHVPDAQMQSAAVAVVNTGPAASLEGDLEKLSLPAVLQSLVLGHKTGKLTISGPQGICELFLRNGALVHAQVGEITGEAVVFEVILWPTGKFKFFDNEMTAAQSVEKRLDGLLVEGLALLDQYNALRKAGLNYESVLQQAYASISEKQFEAVAQKGPVANLEAQKDFYLEVDNKTSLFEHLRRLPLSKHEWIPVLYNLVTVGLVKIHNPQEETRRAEAASDGQLDEGAINLAIKSLTRPETEVFLPGVFQYFVKQELSRFEMDARPISLLVFDFYLQQGSELENITVSQAKILLHRIKTLLRPIDVLGHFESYDFGLLLPQTDGKAASLLAQLVIERVRSSPVPGLEGQSVSLCFGIASVPLDTKFAGGLLLAAKEAKNCGRSRKLPIMEFRQVNQT
jgi:hypothetical protein